MTQTQIRPSATTDGDTSGALARDIIDSLQTGFRANARYRLAQNAVTRNSVDDIALNNEVVFGTDHTFSISLDDWAVTDQKQTGRCWMFAGLNLLRFSARRMLGSKRWSSARTSRCSGTSSSAPTISSRRSSNRQIAASTTGQSLFCWTSR